MRKHLLIVTSTVFLLLGCKTENTKKKENTAELTAKTTEATVKITPISHATAVIEYNNSTIYLDPTGGKQSFASFKTPDFVFITDVHGDHMNMKTLNDLDLTKTTIICPSAVSKSLQTLQAKEIIVMSNGESKSFDGFKLEAIPMYNLREEALKFHQKGRGNGYVLTVGNERIYFSGDTEDIPEMRNLKNIDRAYVCMNLPYTMTVESAASAVLEFKPKQVYPYHYRGTGGLSDVAKFKQLVNEGDTSIEVVQLNWYPNR